MIFPDVNVLVYAHREEQPDHQRYRRWLQMVLTGAQPVGLTLHVVAGFVRVATHPVIFDPPTPLLAALAIENGAVLHTADRGFARFPGLRWRHPLDAAD